MSKVRMKSINTYTRVNIEKDVSTPNIKTFNTEILVNEANFSFAKFRDKEYVERFKERLAKNLQNDKNLIPSTVINGEGISID